MCLPPRCCESSKLKNKSTARRLGDRELPNIGLAGFHPRFGSVSSYGRAISNPSGGARWMMGPKAGGNPAKRCE